MKKSFILIFFLLYPNFVFSEILRPTPNLKPNEVISIQLNALKNNNDPHVNAGIKQTWEFAHPSNKLYTGPLSNFIKMMHSDSYSIMIKHKKHNIHLVEQGMSISFFLVELVDKTGNKFGLQWIVEKVLLEGELKNCWMTISVSQAVLIAKLA